MGRLVLSVVRHELNQTAVYVNARGHARAHTYTLARRPTPFPQLIRVNGL